MIVMNFLRVNSHTDALNALQTQPAFSSNLITLGKHMQISSKHWRTPYSQVCG
jgi:hypothetical protein